MNEKFCISIKISRRFVPKGPIDNYLALVYILEWRRIGDKPSMTDLCGTRGTCVKECFNNLLPLEKSRFLDQRSDRIIVELVKTCQERYISLLQNVKTVCRNWYTIKRNNQINRRFEGCMTKLLVSSQSQINVIDTPANTFIHIFNKSSQRLPSTPVCQHQWMPVPTLKTWSRSHGPHSGEIWNVCREQYSEPIMFQI